MMTQHYESDWRLMPYSRSCELISEVLEPDENRDDSGGMESRSDEIQEATLRFLLEATNEEYFASPFEQKIWNCISFLILSLNDERVDVLLSEIVFNVTSSSVYRAMAPGIRGRIDAKRCENALLDRLSDRDPRVRQNARDFNYFIFGWDSNYNTSDALSRL